MRLFNNKINNIFEDISCYGKKLNLEVLYHILKDNGTYHFFPINELKQNWMNNYFRSYQQYTEYFTIDFVQNKIVKNNGNKIILQK